MLVLMPLQLCMSSTAPHELKNLCTMHSGQWLCQRYCHTSLLLWGRWSASHGLCKGRHAGLLFCYGYWFRFIPNEQAKGQQLRKRFFFFYNKEIKILYYYFLCSEKASDRVTTSIKCVFTIMSRSYYVLINSFNSTDLPAILGRNC